ncbi:MAG: glycoside hydrolase family 95 protein [Edaphobacter sp.]|uniref:glycoside hydrolase family 95 protein n=1 Tax=Edaphobacter sp. TaxID=1934404 RepID=UPI0023875E08|nr:glycoside hydrolase family 95 protein [Edaphobacter sp.]MDE1175612.1 glycoside hydrolase family 95 protein [Edaphobacter sp.]
MHSPTTRRKFLANSAAAAAASQVGPLGWAMQATPSGAAADDEQTPYKLFFEQPANAWPDSLPVGNGRLGACIFGQPSRERIQLNEESIWDGEVRDRNNPQASTAVETMRQLLFAGKVAEAEALVPSEFLAIPQRLPCYQTLGDLHLDFGQMEGITNYRLELNLDTAIATTTFTHQGVDYRREVLSSSPDQAIVIRLTASRPGKINLRATLDRPANFTTAAIAQNRLTLFGTALPVNDNPGLQDKERQVGIKYYAELLAVSTDGTTNTQEALLTIANATAVTLFLDCATSFRYPAGESAMRQAVVNNLLRAAARPYEELRLRHITDHRRLFRRAGITLVKGDDPNASMATDKRLARLKAGADDPGLLGIYFQFGRYLLIGSSRNGTMAANLQGIWNESVDPPWGSKYTININIQMIYWLAERANLSELHNPLFDLIDRSRNPGHLTAERYYNARGIVAHHNTDIWGDAVPVDGLGGGVWPMGAAWLSLHLWDHYDYTGNINFLRDRCYPRLKDNALFLLDYLVTDPATEKFVTGPSCSPENSYLLPDGTKHHLCMAPTMDIEIVRAVLTRLLQAAAVLAASPEWDATTDAEIHNRARLALIKLPSFEIGKSGNLQEWQVDYAEPEPGHRHISHLFALFPDDQITPHRTPELAKAARVTLDRRLAAGGGSTGWSRAWIVCCMARLGDGDAAYSSLMKLLSDSTRSNLFDVCGTKANSPFQLDGNIGGPTGMVEMLLQSHAGGTGEPRQRGVEAAANIIRLLPALPQNWAAGSFHGLRARGGLEIDLEWEGGKATTAVLRSHLELTHHIIAPAGQRIASVTPALEQSIPTDNPGELLLPVQAGDTYTIHFS